MYLFFIFIFFVRITFRSAALQGEVTAAVLVVKAAFMDLTPLTYIDRLHPAQTLLGLTSSLGFYRIKLNSSTSARFGLTSIVQCVVYF